MKYPVIAMKLYNGEVLVGDWPEQITEKMKLPEGCLGMLFVFESKKYAQNYWGKDVELKQIERIK